MLPNEREDLERLAQYIIRNPFSVEKMQVNEPGGSIVYRSGMNPKIRRKLPFASLTADASHRPFSLRSARGVQSLRVATSLALRCCLGAAALATLGSSPPSPNTSRTKASSSSGTMVGTRTR